MKISDISEPNKFTISWIRGYLTKNVMLQFKDYNPYDVSSKYLVPSNWNLESI